MTGRAPAGIANALLGALVFALSPGGAGAPAAADLAAATPAAAVAPADSTSTAAAAAAAPADSAGLPAPATIAVPSRPPLWPLRLATRFLTSNFMEPREGRFHAGIDLKTNGRTGLAAVAVEDGWVRQLRAQPEGYGRDVLLRGDSGISYLYAHLERFTDRLRPLVEAAQESSGRYRAVVTLPPDSLRVRRGEVLALTGQSGTVGPHLHFEVRDDGDRALNPLRAGFAVTDTFPPRLLRVRALPAGPDGRVEGGLAAWSAPVPAGRRVELPPLRASGPVAFAVEVRETVDARAHPVAAYALTAWLDGAEVFAARNDTLPLASTHARRREWLEAGGARAQWLHCWGEPRLPGRVGGLWSAAAPGLSPGRHRVEVTAADLGGGASSAAWWLTIEGPPDSAAARASVGLPGGEAAGAAVARGGWRPDPVDVALAAPGVAEVRLLAPFLELAPAPGGGWRALAAVRPEGDDEPPGWRRLRLAPADCPGLLAPAVLYLRADSLGGAEAARLFRERGLRALGPAARYQAWEWPAAGRAAAPWPGDVTAADLDSAVAVYQQAGPDAWRYRGPLRPSSERDEGAAGWTCDLPGPGRYALLRDEWAPRIGAGPPGGIVTRRGATRRHGVALPRWETVAVSLSDAGAGVDPDRLRAALDGRPLIAEPDLSHGRLLVELPDAAGAGRHLLDLTAVDRAGHVARRRIVLECRAAG